VTGAIRFLLGGRVEEIRACDPTQTVLAYLRETRGLTGTKEGCAEGDCGACTVVLAEPDGDALRYRAVNSCIQFLPTLDGKQLIVVEDLAGPDGTLHPVQQAMVDLHGSQCGFCTPGFVMSLFALYHSRGDREPDREAIDLALAGNLCRCTGYAPIVRAARQALANPGQDRFSAAARETLARLKAIQSQEDLETGTRDRHFYAPRSLDSLCNLLASHPDATLLAGGTDVGLWVTKQLQLIDELIYVGFIPELQVLETRDGFLQIGAAVTYTDAVAAIADLYPAFRPLIERLGAVQVRNAGTVGGNIANGSPIGDMPPGLVAAGARLVLGSAAGERTLDLEDFFISYGRQDLRDGEFVYRILLPEPPGNRLFGTYKVSKRIEQDISAVCGGFGVDLEEGRVVDARVCYGGMAETPRRATACEAALRGRPWARQTIDDAMAAMASDFTPITDVRASAPYRMQVAQNLLLRFYLEHGGADYPVRLGHKQANADATP
jgi:xanthine dehydrogenase small subunit